MKSGPLIFLGVFGVFWSSATLMVDVLVGRELAGEWRSRTFTETTGRVRSSAVTKHYGSKNSTFTADILYDYHVNGRALTGKRLRYGSMGSSSRKSAQSVVEKYPPDSATPVYFDPSNSADAVLETGLSGRSVFTTIFITPFNMVMLGLWLAVLSAATNSRAHRLAGGVCLIQEATRTRARLPRLTAFAAAILTIAGTSFAAIFIVGFGTQMNPSLRTALAAWGSILGVSALVFARRWLKIQSGAEDLVVDQSICELTLPQTFGRKEAIRVPFSDVKSVTVASVAHRGSKGGVSLTFAPTLHFKDGRKDEKLADWAAAKKPVRSLNGCGKRPACRQGRDSRTTKAPENRSTRAHFSPGTQAAMAGVRFRLRSD